MLIARESMVEVLNVVVVADHDVAREGLVSVLDGAAGLAVVAEMEYRRDLVEVLKVTVPDVVVLDHSPPLGDAMELCTALHGAGITSRVVILVDDPNGDSVESALRAGARACLAKDARSYHLIEVVRAAAADAAYGSPLFKPESGGPPRLGASQTAVLHLLVEGKSVREIAEAMGLSRHTVRSYLRQIYRRLGVSSRSEAAAAAVRLRLL